MFLPVARRTTPVLKCSSESLSPASALATPRSAPRWLAPQVAPDLEQADCRTSRYPATLWRPPHCRHYPRSVGPTSGSPPWCRSCPRRHTGCHSCPPHSAPRQDLWNFRWEHAQARIAARRGDQAEAQKHVAAAKAILDKGTIPEQAVFFPYLKGYVAFYAGDYKTALAELSKANPNDPFIQCMIGQTYEKLGEKDKAVGLIGLLDWLGRAEGGGTFWVRRPVGRIRLEVSVRPALPRGRGAGSGKLHLRVPQELVLDLAEDRYRVFRSKTDSRAPQRRQLRANLS